MAKLICGLDEVGRGALAGPLVLCGVVVEDGVDFKKIFKDFKFKDSKKMSKQQRENIFPELVKFIKKHEIEIIDVDYINKHGIGVANKEGFVSLIKRIESEEYIVDGNLNFRDFENVKSIVKADSFIDAVTIAGIIAKVTRDRIMYELHSVFPDYDFLNNVGYGTKKHIDAIREKGKTIHHRDLFIRKMISFK